MIYVIMSAIEYPINVNEQEFKKFISYLETHYQEELEMGQHQWEDYLVVDYYLEDERVAFKMYFIGGEKNDIRV